ncbi:putative uncharacterized protein [Acetobacter sp. CAG:977]|nr:putative uncharacterized protein [Acetobacter sp. CAG:977]
MPLIPDDLGKEELLALLRPLYANGIWPLADGWKLLLALAAGTVVSVALYRRSSRVLRRRKALAALKALEKRYRADSDVSALVGGLSVLMKRTALVRFARDNPAGLAGREWTDFLKAKGAELNEKDEELLQFLAYAPMQSGETQNEEAQHLLETVGTWMRRVL